MKARRATSSKSALIDYIPEVSPHLTAPHHLRPYIDLLQGAVGSYRRTVVAAPPQHGKTESTLHALVWWMQRCPGKQFAYCTYQQKRSERQSLKTQEIAARAGARVVDGTRSGWRIANGASVLFTSIGGALTGEPVSGVLIIDDPFAGPKDAYSPAYRERAIDWYDTVAETRLHPGVPAIVMATRWHPDDLSGKLIKRGWEYLNLPALADSPHDPLGRQFGEALWEEQRPRSMLETRRQANPHAFAALYQGRPRPRGDAVFGDPTFYTSLPATYRRGYGVDMAYTAATRADWSVIVVTARDGERVYVVDVIRKQCRSNVFRDLLGATLRNHGPGPIRWYCSGTEKGVADLLGFPGLQAVPATTDKLVRAGPVSEAWNLGHVLVPEDAPWLGDFLAIVTSFTGVADDHDDDVDALAAAFDVTKTAGYAGTVPVPSRASADDEDDDWDD